MTEMPMQQGNYYLDHGGSFLKDLSPSVKRYTYHGKSQFFNTLDFESSRFDASPNGSEFLLFHASKETIKALTDFQTERTPPTAKYLTAFDTNEQLFLVRMSTAAHSVAAPTLHAIILNNLQPMGLFTSLKGYDNRLVKGASRGKAADFAWGPKRSPRGRPSSPSVTLEVAYSEDDFHLDSGVRFWLDPDNGKANVCLTLRICQSRPGIRIEKWEMHNDRIHRSQLIWITKRKNHTNVSHHPLIIPFESLFLRPPSCPWEKDLEISQQQLKEVAETIWEEQCW
jgi:hypothetical protein